MYNTCYDMVGLNQNELENNPFYTRRSFRTSYDTGGFVYESVKNYESYYNYQFPRNESTEDPITHVDDDKFNENITSTNEKDDYAKFDYNQNEVKNSEFVPYCESKGYYSQQVNECDINIQQNVAIQDNFFLKNNGIHQDSPNLNSVYCYASYLDANSASINSGEENESYSDSLMNQVSYYPYNFEYSSAQSLAESSKTHAEKRKQTYTIKSDSFSELWDTNEVFSSQNLNPLENKKDSIKKTSESVKTVKSKLVSVLKNKNKTPKKSKNNSKRAKSKLNLSQTESLESEIADNTELYNKKLNECQEPQYIQVSAENSLLRLNSEFSSANYFDYIEPTATIIESDMDKLVSPTIELGFFDINQSFDKKNMTKNNDQFISNQGTDLKTKTSSEEESNLTPCQLAEKNLFEKNVLAKKLGFINLFDVSNDAVVKEILYDPSVLFKPSLLDFSLMEFDNIHSQVSKLLSSTLQEISDGTKSLSFKKNNEFIYESSIHHIQNNEDKSSSINKEELYNNFDPNPVKFYFNSNNFNNFEREPKYNSESGEQLYMDHKPGDLVIKIKRIDEGNKYRVENKPVKKVEGFPCTDCAKKHLDPNYKGSNDVECDTCHMRSRKKFPYKRQPRPRTANFSCPLCEKNYCYKQAYENHLSNHQKEEKYAEK